MLSAVFGLTISVYGGTAPERARTLDIHDGYGIAQPLTTLYVDTENPACDDRGPGTMQMPFCTIQAGYDAAADGDEIRVMQGTYVECLFLYDLAAQKGVRVIADAWVNGGDNTSTIIDGSAVPNCTFPGVGVPAAVVNLGGFGGRFEGFTVQGGRDSGIFGVGPVTITNNVVRDNDSTSGGGIYVYSASCYYGNTDLEVSHNEVTGNTASWQGGGISITAGIADFITDPSGACRQVGNSTVTVDSNTIENNSAETDGGGIAATTFSDDRRSASIVITRNTITGNSASSDLLIGYGGGIYGATFGYGTESIEVSNNTLDQNTTLDFGGGASLWIYPDVNAPDLNHSVICDTNHVTGNEAGYGGGGGLDLFLHTRELRLQQTANITARNNTIAGNQVTVDAPEQTFGGGGILGTNISRSSNSPRASIVLEKNRLTSNSAFGFGGGISLFSSADADPDDTGAAAKAQFLVLNNTVVQNDASTDHPQFQGAGGGVFILLETEGDAVARVEMPLNTIAYNTLDNMTLPGGIHAESFIVHDIQGNDGHTELILDNSIIAGNEGIGLGGPLPGQPGIITPGGSDNFYLSVSYNDFFGNTAGDTDGWIVLGPGNIFEDPLFADPPLDIHLSTASPAIDAGDPLLVPEDGQTDIDGDPRVLDGNGDGAEVVDMGADEYLRRTITIEIDIKPGSLINPVNPRNRGVIPVALLGSESFDVTIVDPTSLAFGPLGAETAHDLSKTGTYSDHLQDVNFDGVMDLVTHYRTQATGLDCGDQTSLMTLIGRTFDGQEIEGSDRVETVGCPGPGRPGTRVNRDDSRLPGTDGVQSIEQR